MKKTASKKTNQRGFTLIELLIVISILAIMASVSIVVLNAKRHIGEARNVRRDIDVQTLSLGLYQYALDNGGDYPNDITTTPAVMCRLQATDCTGMLNVEYLYGKYVTTPISDPLEENPNSSGYTVAFDGTGHIVVNAIHAENNKVVLSRR